MKTLQPLLITLSTTLFLIGCGSSSDTQTPLRVTSFVEDSSANYTNPDRGFYKATYQLNLQNDDLFANIENHTLAYAVIDLKNYIQTDTIDTQFIQNLTANLESAQTHHVKLILRILYRDTLDEQQDPPLERILSHLQQLTPTLQNFKDSISVIQAGLIGAWGEWHTFTGDFSEENPDYKTNRIALLDALHTIFPEKYIQLRTTMHKELLFGASQNYADISNQAILTPQIAYAPTLLAHIGQHDDCFLASASDNGTYADNDINFWRDYAKNDALYAPLGGESCVDENSFTNCSYALEELKTLHFAFLNENFQPDVIQRWKDEGCFEEIKENLGYNLVAQDFNLTQTAPNNVQLNLILFNKGYASPYVNYDVTYIFHDQNSSENISFEQKKIDTRVWYPQETTILTSDINTTQLNTNDSYCISIQLSQANNFVRFSNETIWDTNLKTNSLGCNVRIVQ